VVVVVVELLVDGELEQAARPPAASSPAATAVRARTVGFARMG
jgi:hypothetical protein